MPEIAFPEWFICPISRCHFRVPVAVITNNFYPRIYEKAFILEHLKSDSPNKHLDPISQLPILNTNENQLRLHNATFERLDEFIDSKNICSREKLKKVILENKPEEFDKLNYFPIEYYFDDEAYPKSSIIAWCAKHNKLEWANRLLLEYQKEATPRELTETLMNLFDGVIFTGNIDFVTLLLTFLQDKQRLNKPSRTRIIPLHSAVRAKHIAIVKLLHENGAHLEVQHEGKFKLTPLLYAIAKNDKDIFNYLYSKGANLNFISPVNFTAQKVAIAFAPDFIPYLSELGLKFSINDLFFAVNKSYPIRSILRLIIILPIAEIQNTKVAGKTFLHQFLAAGFAPLEVHDIIVRLIKRTSMNYLVIDDVSNNTTLQTAFNHHHIELAHFMCDYAQEAIDFVYFNKPSKELLTLHEKFEAQVHTISTLEAMINQQNLGNNKPPITQLYQAGYSVLMPESTLPYPFSFFNYNYPTKIQPHDTHLINLIQGKNFGFLAQYLQTSQVKLTQFEIDNVIRILTELTQTPAEVEILPAIITMLMMGAKCTLMRADGKTPIDIALDNNYKHIATFLINYINKAINYYPLKVKYMREAIETQTKLIQKREAEHQQNKLTQNIVKPDFVSSSATMIDLFEENAAEKTSPASKRTKRKLTTVDKKQPKESRGDYGSDDEEKVEQKHTSLQTLTTKELIESLFDFFSSKVVNEIIEASTVSNIKENFKTCYDNLQTANINLLDVNIVKNMLEEIEARLDPTYFLQDRLVEIQTIVDLLWPVKDQKAFLKAIKTNHVEKINQIILKYPHLNDLIIRFDFVEGKLTFPTDGLTPLMCAAIWEQTGEILLQLKADTNIVTAMDRVYFGGCHAGLIAAAYGNISFLKQLLQVNPALLETPAKGPKIKGFTPLLMAAHFSQFETVQYLLNSGANINAITSIDSAFMKSSILDLAFDSEETKPGDKLKLLKLLINEQNLGSETLLQFSTKLNDSNSLLAKELIPLVDEIFKINLFPCH